jgi:hypothetical protein
MGLFRKSPDVTFWRTPPFRSPDPILLYQHGITCVTRDGAGMMRTGWAIWGLAGLHQHQTSDFLYDGFREWHESADIAEQRAFVSDVFVRAISDAPSFPPDIYAAPRELVEPASAIYGARPAAVASAHPDFITPEAASLQRS